MKSNKLKISIFVLFINVFSLIVSSYAWFLIKPTTGESNNITVYTGDYLYVSQNPITGYQPTLDFQKDIVGGIYETGQRLVPVTSYDGLNFFRKNGTVYNHPEDPNKRWYFQFDLYLKSKSNKNVYLGLGSGFTGSTSSEIQKAARISFTSYSNDVEKIVEQVFIWESSNLGVGSYGEGIYDENYTNVENPDFICNTLTNPSGYLICPTQELKTISQQFTYLDENLAIAIKPPEDGIEDISGIPPLVHLEADAEVGRLLTIRIWIEGFDADSNHLFLLSNEVVEFQLDFSMNLYFASRDV